MAYQYLGKPQMFDEEDDPANACRSPEEHPIVWTLLDMGLRVSGPRAFRQEKIEWRSGGRMFLATVKEILGHDRLSTAIIYLNQTDQHVVEESQA